MKAISLWQPYVAGVLHGDGWCTQLTIGLRTKDRDFAQAFFVALREGFPNIRAPKTDERGYWLFRCGNKRGTFSQLKQFEPLTATEVAAWLRGLFDSEGNAQLWHMPHRSPNAYHRRIAFYSTDQTTLSKAANFLALLDIPHTMRATNNSATHRGTKTVHELRVVRREGFEAFAKVGSSIERKHITIKRIAATYQDAASYCAFGGKKGAATRLARRAAGGAY